MIRHGDGIHCIHIYGWFIQRWCHRCRHQWEEFETVDPMGPKARFRQLADADLARSVLEALERGEIPPPPGYTMPEEIPSIFTRITPSDK
jgi:hypothetical protein